MFTITPPISQDFAEIVEIKRNREGKTLKYLADLIGGKSIVYTKQVIAGIQNGENARKYRQIIAEDLGISLAELEELKNSNGEGK